MTEKLLIEKLRTALREANDLACNDHCAVDEYSPLEAHDKDCQARRLLIGDPIARCAECAAGTCRAH
jgi:hypothetical protein